MARDLARVAGATAPQLAMLYSDVPYCALVFARKHEGVAVPRASRSPADGLPGPA